MDGCTATCDVAAPVANELKLQFHVPPGRPRVAWAVGMGRRFRAAYQSAKNFSEQKTLFGQEDVDFLQFPESGVHRVQGNSNYFEAKHQIM